MESLCTRDPKVTADRLLADLVVAPRFADVRFVSYRPDPDHPSQRAALERATGFAAAVSAGAATSPRWFPRWGSGRADQGPGGLYLDGGFGVGKTHLLASLWHQVVAGRPAKPARYAAFGQLTALVGALGFGPAVAALTDSCLLCVDEFELDDPGDTVLVSTLLSRLAEGGVRLAATSNTLPDRLGEGRFAAVDFLREIQALAARFEVVRVDGPDFRRRDRPDPPPPSDPALVRSATAALPGATLDAFEDLLAYLSALHHSRYCALLDGVALVGVTGLREVTDQAAALRLVTFVDRLYELRIPVLLAGQPVDRLFGPELLTGGYRKKYLRALSRLVALAGEGPAVAGLPD